MRQALPPLPADEQAVAWRRALAEGRAALMEAYRRSGNAAVLLRGHCRLVDGVLGDIWRAVRMAPEASLIAVGGYGRGELFPHSDVDLLVLLPREADAGMQQNLERLVTLLWDIGLEVGHSVRTLPQCLDEAEKDVTVQTNLMEARLLCGERRLFAEFDSAVHAALDRRTFFEAKILEQQQRHTRFHDTAYNLEPNLKDSPGGLRDLQNVLWISHALGLGNNWQELVTQSLITGAEARRIKRHERFLQNLRVRLHYLAKRREDRLLFDFQVPLAAELGLADRKNRSASEQLMQRYYRTAKAIRLLNEILLQNLRTRIFPVEAAEPRALSPHFQERGGVLEARDDEVFQRNPHAILESFLLMEQHSELKGMSAATLRALWRATRLITPAFRRDPQNRALFMDILRQPRGITHELRRMNQYGILGRYIPAFGRVVGQMQHDLFHVYTVDEHILMVLRNLRRFTVPEYAHEFPLCSRLISAFERPEILFLSALFHDIAKGRGGDHSRLGCADARRFCKLHGLDKTDAEMVAWLVGHHLTMSAVAQKQDLSDPDVIAAFAKMVGDERHLAALYLLTVADIRGTSPKVWNAWKGKLLEDLFRTARRYLTGGAGTLGEELQARQIEALRILRQHAIPENAHRALWAQLDEGYFLRHEAQEIAWHTRLLNRQVNSVQPIVKARLSAAGEGIQVMIYTADRDDLFARICGFFERVNFNIVEAKIHTTRHGYALDSFLILDEENRTSHYRDLLSYIEYELAQRLLQDTPLEPPLQGRLSRHLKHFPIAPQVSIRPDEKGAYHILSVTAGDRPGLLSRIARVFVAHRIHLHTAKINTLGERAEDTFLIAGEELENPKAVIRLETDLLKQLET
ncbi:MAG: [protein-PII] uridylyltransferase [Pseudomonadota bacterium]|jgi:[protein-PII] uridylyltransferase